MKVNFNKKGHEVKVWIDESKLWVMMEVNGVSAQVEPKFHEKHRVWGFNSPLCIADALDVNVKDGIFVSDDSARDFSRELERLIQKSIPQLRKVAKELYAELSPELQEEDIVKLQETKVNTLEMRNSLNDIAHMVDFSKSYSGLPDQLKPYYAYIIDGGHCVMAITSGAQKLYPDAKMDELETPVPIKYVLAKGYTDIDGYILIDARYDPNFGVDVGEEYYEY